MGRIALYDNEAPSPRRSYASRLLLLLVAVSVAAALLYADLPDVLLPVILDSQVSAKPFCPKQPEPLVPSRAFKVDDGYRSKVAEHLAAAVRVPTVNYDGMGDVETDSRWLPFWDLHKLLDQQYAELLQHPSVNLTIVNKLGRVITVAGSDPTLKPLLLMSHQDVVPVPKDTIDRWSYPPFEGRIEGDFVYGRGACDCKALLISQYEALQLLLKSGWQPRRTVLVAEGFDEETTGQRGAKKIMEYLESVYGRDSMLAVIDEGTGSERLFGHAFALPATAEKGYLDVSITVGVPGGHSSVPPKSTAIGILAKMITAIEEGDNYPAAFSGADDPLLQFQICAAEHAQGYPKVWRRLVKKLNWKKLAAVYAADDPESRALISTTQAVDLVSGGSKINSLPESANTVVNHRISFGSSVSAVKKHVEQAIKPVAEAYNLTIDAFGSNPAAKGRFVELSVFGEEIEPAPTTPTSGPVWDLFAGSVRAVLRDDKNGNRPYTVSPYASSGNTDTQRVWSLTRNIFRYVGAPITAYNENAHTVDEKTSISDLVKTVEWLWTIVQNADAFADF